jgi:hypothetical protein
MQILPPEAGNSQPPQKIDIEGESLPRECHGFVKADPGHFVDILGLLGGIVAAREPQV